MQQGSMKQVSMAKIPNCDICKAAPAMYDSPTVHGPWAYQCGQCNLSHGIPGTQLASRLVLATDIEDRPMYDPAIVECTIDMGLLHVEDLMNLLEDSGQSIEDLGY